jgi:hypothetical protein
MPCNGKKTIFVLLNCLQLFLMRVPIHICTLCLVLWCHSASAQTTALKLNTSFLLGIRQVGGFAIEHAPDSSAWSYGLGLEFGNFESRQLGTGSSQMDTRTVVGIGISPHFRYYPFRKNKLAPYGFFLEGNYRLRFVRETEIQGIVVNPTGYDLDDAQVKSANKWLSDQSFAIGYKTGIGKRNLEFEALTGLGRSATNQELFYRFEIFITGIFSRKSHLGDDFFW